jgi:hypothetical protein
LTAELIVLAAYRRYFSEKARSRLRGRMVCRMLNGVGRWSVDARLTVPFGFLLCHSQLGLALIFSMAVPFYFLETKKSPRP